MLRYFVLLLMVSEIIGLSLYNDNVRRWGGCRKKTTVYKNGKIYTVDTKLTDWSSEPKDCMVVTGDEIVFLGTESEARKIGYMTEKNKIIDLNRRTVLPGIHDVHMHPLEGGNPVIATCHVDRDEKAENVTDIIKKCAPNQKGTEWVIGFGHSINTLLEHIRNGDRDPKDILDDALPDKPCVLVEEGAHSVWVNSEALRRAGITNDTLNEAGGIIMKNETTGEPNGIIFENAALEVMDLALNSTEMDFYKYKGLVDTMEMIAANGITSICDARVYWKKRGHLETWKSACDDGKIKTRTLLNLWAYPSDNDVSQIEKIKDKYSNLMSKNCLMKATQVKVFSDGLIDSTTAAVLSKYNIDLHLQGLEANVGMNYFTESRIKTYVRQLQSFGNKGFDIHIHAIGDRGVREALNALEATRINGTRHRITHIELLSLQDVPRFKELDVIADFQVAGYFAMPDFYIPNLTYKLGKTRAETNYMLVKQVLDTGAKTTLSSDWPVGPMNPFIGIGQAVNRGPESVTVKQAIEMYTINPAYVMRHEHITGSLEVGKAADFIIIDQDILKVDKNKIKDTLVYETVLAGKTTYRRKKDKNSEKGEL